MIFTSRKFKEKPSKKFIIFTDVYNENSKLGKQSPTEYQGTNLYEYKGENELSHTRFKVYLAGYIISAMSLLLLLCVLKQKSLLIK